MTTIAEFLANYPDEIQSISQLLRQIVQRAMPQANEILFASQNHIGYCKSDSMHERIIYICPMKDYVRLGFMRGTQLADPEHLLIGEGKWLRHIKVRTLEVANSPALEALVMAAWNYAESEINENQ